MTVRGGRGIEEMKVECWRVGMLEDWGKRKTPSLPTRLREQNSRL